MIAYIIVIFVYNLSIAVLAKAVHFDVLLSYKGVEVSGKEWTDESIFLIFFFSSAIEATMAIFFGTYYYKLAKRRKEIKLLYLWIFIISSVLLLGDMVTGLFVKTPVETALETFGLPLAARIIIGVVALYAIFLLGRRIMFKVLISANLYFPRLSSKKIKSFLNYQILLPAITGLLLIVLYRLPNLGEYQYKDLITPVMILILVLGVYWKSGKQIGLILAKQEIGMRKSSCKLSVKALTVLIVVFLVLRIGLANGINL